MPKPDIDNPDVSYHFFKAISAKDRSYLCDFYKVIRKNRPAAYRINMQSLKHKEQVVEMIYNDASGWRILNKPIEITPDIEWKFITAIIEQLKVE